MQTRIICKALHHLGEFTVEITTDDLLGNIFSKFCIGKHDFKFVKNDIIYNLCCKIFKQG
jgi:hypothetical protein